MIVTLSAGPLSTEIVPAVGGAIARFDRGDQPLFRRAVGPLAHVLDAGCFPIVPYVNRIRNGRFECDGRVVVLQPNMPPDRSPLHGQGWLAAWKVAAADERTATLRFVHDGGEWPWRYESHQHITLDEGGLSIRLTCRNLSPEPMPCGLALHPYYPCDAETVLDTQVATTWTIDADVLPVDRVPATGRYDLRDRRICGADLDHGFDGWSGQLDISWPGKPGLRLLSPGAGYTQVYAPATGGFFVAEPVQHANAALNAPQGEWAGLGLAMLAEGEERVLEARFEVVEG